MTIVGNRFQGAAGATGRHGVQVGADCSRTRLLGNLISNWRNSGIFLNGSAADLVSDNVVGGNLANGLVASGSDAHIVNNNINGNTGFGIVDGGQRTRIERNLVVTNTGAFQIDIHPGTTGGVVAGNSTAGAGGVPSINDAGGSILVENR